jgi:hypothetical protein
MTDPVVRVARPDSWRRAFIARHRGRCHYCNRPGTQEIGPDDRPWHIDHVVALARGGLDEEENLTLACKRCNLAKGVQPAAQFAAFARAAFWVPDDWRASEYELDRLMELHGGAVDKHGGDPSWRIDCQNYQIVRIGPDGLPYLDVVVSLGGRDLNPEIVKHREAMSTLELIAEMHRLIPALVAEIRMHRGECDATESGVRHAV